VSKDPIVDEMRAARAATAAEHGHDLKKIIAALRRKEGADGRRVVDLTAKRPSKRHPRLAETAAQHGMRPTARVVARALRLMPDVDVAE
jgi:hypothetical protein